MRKQTTVKGHLPGDAACEARQVFRAFRDNPAARKAALVQSMKDRKPNPCAGHAFLSDQPKPEKKEQTA
jgi:hypothetical protein